MSAVGLSAEQIAKAREEASGCTYFGVPVLDLDRDDLLHMAMAGWRGWNRSIERETETINLYTEIMRRRSGQGSNSGG